MTDWSERIPAAIAKGKAWLGGRRVRWIPDTADYITAGEVALASALWLELDWDGNLTDIVPPLALIAYCEKMEALP